MLRHVFLFVLCVLVSLAAVAAESHTAAANTHAAVKAYVESAAKVVAKNGPDCATLSSKSWMSGDYYVFVVGPDDKLVCHPKLAGKPAAEVIDVNGKQYVVGAGGYELK